MALSTVPSVRWWLLAATVAVVGTVGVTQFSSAAKEKSELRKHMSKVSDGYKRLRRSARRGRFTMKSVQRLVKMQKHALAAKQLTPSKVKELPTAQKRKFLIKFRKMMADTIHTMMQAEIAILEQKTEKAKKLVQKLVEQKDKGHKAFDVDE